MVRCVGSRLGRLDWLERPAGWIAIAGALGLAFLLAVALVLLAPGLYVAVMPHDSLSMADIGYRMAQGQRPGLDFHSAFGAVFQVQMGVAWRLGGTIAWCLKWATALFFLALCPILVLLARTRFSNLQTVVLLLATILLGCAPYARADPVVGGVTYAMLYNREAWVLLLLLLLFWLPARRETPWWLDGFSAGVLLTSLLYFKASYGGVALMFIGLWALMQPTQRRAALLALVVLAVFVLAFEGLYGFGFNLAYFKDILQVARSGDSRLIHILANLFLSRAELLGGAVFIPLLAWALGRRFVWPDLAFVAFCAGAGLLIVWQNAQIEGLVTLWAGVALMLSPQATVIRSPSEQSPTIPPTPVARRLIPLAAYGAFAALTLAPSGAAVADASLGALRTPAIMGGPQTLTGLKLMFPNDDKRLHNPGLVNGDEYERILLDGAAVLSACPARASLVTLDLFEPFTVLTGRPPNHGWTWLHFGHSFSDKTHLAPEREFAGVDCVMQPKHPTNPQSTAALLRVYGPYLASHFTDVRSSPEWTLRRRIQP